MAAQPATVLFDAECGLCQRARAFGDGKGRPGLLRFVPNTDPVGRDLLRRHGLLGRERDTMVAIVGDRAYVASSAVVRVAARLRLPHRLMAALWLLPRPLRDAGYRAVARRRHRFRRPPA